MAIVTQARYDRRPNGGLSWGLVLFSAALFSCAKLPPELALPRLPITDPAFQNALEVFTGAPIIGGNQVEILLNGDETFPAITDAIRAAQRTVMFEAYIFRKSTVGDQIIQAFVERCQAGVRAAILFDAHGSSNVPMEYVERLKAAGCQVVPDFRPLRPWKFKRANLRNHRRIVVVDGRVGFTGGYGIDEMWVGNGRMKDKWRETNVRLEGPVVQDLQVAFLEHWREATGELLGGQDFYPYPPVAVADVPVRVQVVSSSPNHNNFSMYTVFLQAIMSAQRSILIATPYLLPGEQMTAALANAVQRGVTVIILVPAVITEAWIEYLVQETQREEFVPLLAGGIQLYEYYPGMLHTKVMIVDGIWATVGSTNLDNRSMGLNDELNIICYDQSVAERLKRDFNEDFAFSRKITPDQLRRRGWWGRLLGFLALPLQNHL